MFQRRRQGAVHVIEGDSPLTKDLAAQVQTVFEPLLGGGQAKIVLNLRDVPLVDSAGLELLLDLQDALEQHGGELKLASASTLVEEILTITSVCRRFESFRDTTSAVGSFVQ